jgi:putative hydrolase of HD superfamily
MSSFEQRVLHLFEAIHPLDRIQRAGFILRGVTEPESVAAHSHFVAVMTLLFLDQYPSIFDRDRALTMALIHDLCESKLMDIPMPSADAHLREAKDEAEVNITRELLEGFGERLIEYQRDFVEAGTPEARLVRGLDKAQMMIKVLMYEREGRGRLREFWVNPKNFADYGIAPVSDLFDVICEDAGRPRPR